MQKGNNDAPLVLVSWNPRTEIQKKIGREPRGLLWTIRIEDLPVVINFPTTAIFGSAHPRYPRYQGERIEDFALGVLVIENH